MQRQLTLSGRLTDKRATDRFACLPIIFRLVTTAVFFTGIEFRFLARFRWISHKTKNDIDMKCNCKDN